MSEKSKEAKEIIESLRSIIPDEWKTIPDPTKIRDFIKEMSRNIPPDLFKLLKESIFSEIIGHKGPLKLKLRLVIDSNIIIADCFRVARGRPLSTLRLIQSPFLELMAPKVIINEVYRQIKLDIPKDADLSIALEHANKILNNIKIIENIKDNIYIEGYNLKKNLGNDVLFIQLAIESNVKAIVSRDKRAFDNIPNLRRWEMSDTSEAVLSIESGTIMFSLVYSGTRISLDIIRLLILPLLDGTKEIVVALLTAIKYGASSILSALDKIPEWVWYLLIASLLGVVVAALIDSDIRYKIEEYAEKAYSLLISIGDAVFSFLNDIIKAISDLLLLFTDVFGPYIYAFGGAIYLTLSEFLEYI